MRILDFLGTRWRRLRGCCLILVLIALLLILATCVGVGWAIRRVAAASDDGLDVILVIDQSNSLWELGGVGSDPQKLRMEGARLFATYLGMDGTARDHRLGVVFFGTQPTLVTPLTSLMNPTGRQDLLTALGQQPKPMGWTDINAALALVYRELFESERANPTHDTAVVIFTDGRPHTEKLGAPAAGDAYLSDLQAWIRHFTNEGAAVFTVLLSNTVTDADQQIHDVYRPLWADLAESGIGVSFYDARANQDLAAIYHDVVVQLHRDHSQGAILDQTVEGSAHIPVEIPAGWRWANFVVHKSDPALEVSILRPDGNPLQAGDPGLRHTGEPGATRHEVWSVDRPMSGQWRVQARGQGTVTIWLDYQLSPATLTPMPTATPKITNTSTPMLTATPTATNTPNPIPTWTATSTQTPSPTPTWIPVPSATPTPLSVSRARLEILKPQVNGRYVRGRPIPVAVRLASGDAEDIHASLTWNDQSDPLPVSLEADETGLLTGETPSLDTTGVYTLSVRQTSDLGRGVIFEDEVQVSFTVEPGGPPWGWILATGFLTLCGGAGGLWWRHRSRLLLDGTLHLVQGPKGEKAGHAWNLGQLGRESVTLGRAAGCDIVLAHDPSLLPRSAVIRARRNAAGNMDPILTDLSNDGMVMVNGKKAGTNHLLNDGDLIQLGAYHLRYENLSLRVRTQAWQPRRET